MFDKLIIAGAILFFSSPYVFSADREIFGNCENYKGVVGKINSVSVGVDEETAGYISFEFTKKDGTAGNLVSVKSATGDAGGHEMFLALMTATISNLDFEIYRCVNDQLAGFILFPPDKPKTDTEK